MDLQKDKRDDCKCRLLLMLHGLPERVGVGSGLPGAGLKAGHNPGRPHLLKGQVKRPNQVFTTLQLLVKRASDTLFPRILIDVGYL